VSHVLFERDYSNVGAVLAEYRKGEIAKKLEAETDPEKQVELIMRREAAKANLKRKPQRRRRKKCNRK